MSDDEYQWCSWCLKKTKHKLVEKNYLTRNEYKCTSCGNYTVQCRYCKNMATYKPQYNDSDGIISNLQKTWASECCAEHDGTIANFEALSKKLTDIEDYKILLESDKWNLAKGGKIATGMVAGTAVFGPLVYVAAPAIASSLGAAGLLGAASTGTAISTLSGAALTSASLAALGPGGMAGGIAFLTAVGAGLGGVQGGAISNGYFGDIEDFKIRKVKMGTGPSIIFINGFLSQKNQDTTDWEKSISEKYANNTYYHTNWEASALSKLGSLSLKDSGKEGLKKLAIEFGKIGTKEAYKKIAPLGWANFASTIFGNPWHKSMLKASLTGILLADIIARTKNKEDYILMGHSLGARVIYYLLNALSTKNEKYIKDVYLLGGAVDRKDCEGWNNAIKAVKGNIFNFYSENDQVLNILYKSANLGISASPIGLGNIEVSSKNIINKDVSHLVNGHMEYKENFGKILNEL